MKKFIKSEVLDIYYSTDTIENLSEKYNVRRYNIITIKRKIHYSNITKDINELPGFNIDDRRFPIPVDLIEQIFYDTGDYKYFKEKYGASKVVVNSIKNRKSFKKITSKLLGEPRPT